MMNQLLRPLLMVTAGAFVCLFLFVSLSRMAYPYELEWMEGAMLDHVWRLSHGEGIYVEPSTRFVPFIYTPFYYVISALFAIPLGLDFWVLRLVSLLATLGTLGLIFQFVYGETKCRFCAILSIGFYSAAFGVTGGWYDLARVDSLFIFLLLGGFMMLSTSNKISIHLFAGLCLSLAWFTKQAALPIALALLLVMPFVYTGRLRWMAGISFLASSLCFFLYCQLSSNGWFWFYTFQLPQQHYFHWWFLVQFIWEDVTHVALIAGVVLLISCIVSLKKRKWLFLVFVLGSFGVSALARMHSGGFDNVLMPAFLSLSLGLGLGVHELQQPQWQGWIKRRCRLSFVQHPSGYLKTLHLLLIFQFMLLVYNPWHHLPTQADRMAGDRFIERLADIEGEVFLPYHGLYLTLVGKPMQAHYMAMMDVLRGDEMGSGEALWNELITNIENKKYTAIVLDDFWLKEELKGHYQLNPSPFQDFSVFLPVTGHRARPEFVYVPTK